MSKISSILLFIHKLVIAGGCAYALGMNPYFLVLGAYVHNHPSTIWLSRSAYIHSPRFTERSSGACG